MSVFPDCSCELLFSACVLAARLGKADGPREHQPLQDTQLCLETGFGGRAAEEERERGVL